MRKLILTLTILLTFLCFTGCPSPSTPNTIPYTPNSWLIVMYMDADNDLNDSIWADLYNAQIGLSYAMKTDRSPEPGYPDLKVIMLWDGWASDSCQNNSSPPRTRVHSRSEIYELGPMDTDTAYAQGNGDTSWLISSFSKRLTNNASCSWLPEEPDMGNVNTLTYYLTWINNNYNAEHKVLILNNHGAGTEQEAGTGGAFARSLCSDDSHTTEDSMRSLTATDVKSAIAYSGFHPNVICMDCCLQGNVETTYILRGSADYLVSSANIAYSNNYASQLANMNNINSPRDFACSFVNTYATRHATNTLSINSTKRSSHEKTLTQAAYDLSSSKQVALYNAINSLAEVILSETNTVKDGLYNNYLKQKRTDILNCKGMAYPGTCVYLNDIGFFCKNILADSTLSTGVKSAAQNVISALNDVIVSSWMGKYAGTYSSAIDCDPPVSANIYYKKNLPSITATSDYTEQDGQFGLTIMTQTYDNRISNGYYYFLTNYSSWTGYSPNWGQLLAYWYQNCGN